MSHKSNGTTAGAKLKDGDRRCGHNAKDRITQSLKGAKGKNKKISFGSEDIVLASILDKLHQHFRDSDEEIDHLRNLTSRLLNYLKNLEVPKKIQDGLILLVKILKTSKDVETIRNVVQIINNQLLFRQSYRATVATLINGDVITALLESLFVVNAAHDKENLLLLDIHALIANIATKDPDFSLKVKKADSMKLTIPLMKCCSEKLLQLRPLLLVLKLATSDCSCTSYYGKLGVLPQLLHLINSLSRNQSTSLKLVLEILAQLTKSKFNSREVVAQAGIRLLFNQLETWEKVDGINKLKIIRAILICLNNLAELKAGRGAIYDVEGLGMLYRFCHGLPLLSDYDSIISLATTVAHRCLPPKWLPIDNTIGIVTFQLPPNIPLSRSLQSDSGSYEDDDNDSFTSSDDEDNTPLLVARSKLLTSMGELSTSEKVFYSAFLPELELLNGAANKSLRMSQHKENSILTSNRRSSSPLRSCDIFSPDKLQDALSSINISRKDKDRTTISSQPSSKRGSFEGEMKSQAAAGNDAGSCPVISQIPALANVNMVDEKKRLDSFIKEFKFTDALKKNVSATRHTAPFIKLAHPELNADKYFPSLEPLHQKDFPLCREMLLQNLDALYGGVTSKKVVYDYESSISNMGTYDDLTNEDAQRLGKSEDKSGVLHFESRFECGNLRKAIMLGSHEYELLLNPDINSDHHHQWFYFEVSNMEAGVSYSFYITNCEKNNSQFNFGMKPLIYSVREATLGRAYWVRSGHDVCYYRNYYSCPPGAKGSTYFTTYFTTSFQHPNDVCYIAYHYPYSYSLLQTHLYEWEHCHDKNSIYFKRQTLCHTLGGNEVPILTITSNSSVNLAKRPVIFLTSRVHPGETNASFVMKGTLDFLLSDRPSAESVRENFIFKIIPMLNPDGVINGSHRCSLSGFDLNRCWKNPDKELHPTIYHAKRFMQYLNSIGSLPLVYCDYHGHSRRKNIFVYGCNSKLSWLPEDRLSDDNCCEILPKLLYQLAPAFSLSNCCFTVEQNRETTARVTLWRELGIKFSYTMESSYCGCDQGPYKDHHLGIPQLREMGMKFCQAILHLYAKTKGSTNKIIVLAKVKRDEIQNNDSTDEGEFDDDELEPT